MVRTASSLTQLNEVQANPNEKSVLFFWAEWHEPSRTGGQMQGSFSALSQKYSQVKFVLVEAEQVPDISEKFSVTVVPSFFACVGGRVVEKLEGASPAELSNLVKKLAALDVASLPSTASSSSSSSVVFEEERKKILFQRLEKLIRAAPVMLFMKGSPSAPRCGFSRQIVEILNNNSIAFASFDILTDEDVRAGLKEYSDWPTYPQLYVNGTLVGGLDIVKEMEAGGSLKEQLAL